MKIQLFFDVHEVIEYHQNSRLVGNPLKIAAGPVLQSLKFFLHLRLLSEVKNPRKSLETFGDLRKSSEILGNL